ncbi:MAG: hypothetical protein WC881_03605 [Elusimicrobiota bacterium]|jgi:hypothetical protein
MSKKEVKPQPETVKSIEEIILNYQPDKYSAIPLAALWAKELRRKEENRHLTVNDILEMALRDVLTGSVDWKNIKKQLSPETVAGGLQTPSAGEAEPKKSKPAKA